MHIVISLIPPKHFPSPLIKRIYPFNPISFLLYKIALPSAFNLILFRTRQAFQTSLPPPPTLSNSCLHLVNCSTNCVACVPLQNSIPVLSPALTDGSLGDMIFFHSYKKPGLVLDIVEGESNFCHIQEAHSLIF